MNGTVRVTSQASLCTAAEQNKVICEGRSAGVGSNEAAVIGGKMRGAVRAYQNLVAAGFSTRVALVAAFGTCHAGCCSPC